MNADSPFVLSRFEYEPRHLYFLPKQVFAQLEHPKPTQLIGTRGTGKTTLLQALNWSERLTSESLAHEIGGKGFGKHYIGIYIKLPDTQLQTIDEWLLPASTSQRSIVLGIYLDLLWLELLVDAVAELVLERVFVATATDERKCVQDVLDVVDKEYEGQDDWVDTRSPRTFKDLADMFRASRRSLERHAFAGNAPTEAMRGLPIEQVGSFGRRLSAPLAAFCDEHDEDDGEPWHFKICMDEAEVLNDFQIQVLNTMIRLTTAPVFHVLSFVSAPGLLTGTLLPDLTLSEADRQLVILDEMTETSFRELTEGVANVRVRTKLGDASANFDVRATLGRLNINGLLQSILESSVDAGAKRLLALAREYQIAGVFGAGPSDDPDQEVDSRSAPIYQTYLVEQLGLRPPDTGPNWKRRKEDSAKFRKRMVAAYLSICRQFGPDVRYASSDMVLQMSDRCIRDFLAFMHEIFSSAGISLQEFLQKTIPPETQNAAIRSASKHKRATIAERGVSSPTETGRLIDALSLITQIIQTESGDKQHLRASERGIFAFTFREGGCKKWSHLLELIADAGETGFLRIVEAEDSCWRFRVHKSLAAAYGFSYRGAYYSCRLEPEDIEPLIAVTDRKVFHAGVRSLGLKLAGALPFDLEEENIMKSNAPLFEGLQ